MVIVLWLVSTLLIFAIGFLLGASLERDYWTNTKRQVDRLAEKDPL